MRIGLDSGREKRIALKARVKYVPVVFMPRVICLGPTRTAVWAARDCARFPGESGRIPRFGVDRRSHTRPSRETKALPRSYKRSLSPAAPRTQALVPTRPSRRDHADSAEKRGHEFETCFRVEGEKTPCTDAENRRAFAAMSNHVHSTWQHRVLRRVFLWHRRCRVPW